jgi:hypothetical protein
MLKSLGCKASSSQRDVREYISTSLLGQQRLSSHMPAHHIVSEWDLACEFSLYTIEELITRIYDAQTEQEGMYK